MGTRNVSRQADALARARERRRALDRSRDEHDQRVEEATASVLVARTFHAETQAAANEAAKQVGIALGLLIAEDVTVERAAALVEIDAAEVRRFIRASRDSIDPFGSAGVEAR